MNPSSCNESIISEIRHIFIKEQNVVNTIISILKDYICVTVADEIDDLTMSEIRLKFLENIKEIKKDKKRNKKRKKNVQKKIDIFRQTLGNHINKIEFYYKCLYNINLKIKNLKTAMTEITQEYIVKYKIKNKINTLLNSNLECTSKKKAVIYTHLGMGDMLIMNGAIRYISLNYNQTVIFCKKSYYPTIKRFFEDDTTIVFELIEENPNDITYHKINHYFMEESFRRSKKYYKHQNYDIYLTGTFHPGTRTDPKWYTDFYNKFYEHLGLSANIRFDYFHINHDYEYENKLFNETVANVGEYIFIHDNPDRNRAIDLNFLNNSNKCIYHPNFNYYENNKLHKYYNIWKGFDNYIVNYSKIIENASEIYAIDSSFLCLSLFLNLKAKIRHMYTGYNYNAKDFFRPEERHLWTIH